MAKENFDVRLSSAKEAIELSNYNKAINILDALIAENCSEAMVVRSQIGLPDDSEEKFNSNRIHLLKKAASLGNATALYLLGMHYETGDIVHANIELANRYLGLAAEKKHPHALWQKGMRLLYQIEGGNVEQGLRLIEEAASLKSEGALTTLASFYQNGEFGYPKDAHKANELVSIAESNNCLHI